MLCSKCKHKHYDYAEDCMVCDLFEYEFPEEYERKDFYGGLVKQGENEMKVHDLKISPKYFDDVNNNKKNFEIRKDNRNYQVGDLINFREWDNGQYTGREIRYVPITYILRNVPEYGLKDGYCILGL